MIKGILGGVILETLKTSAAWMRRYWREKNGGMSESDREIVAWFDTYELTDRLDLPEAIFRGIPEGEIKLWLTTKEVQAVFHELLAAHVCNSSKIHIEAIKENFKGTFLDFFIDADPKDFSAVPEEIFDAVNFEVSDIVGRVESSDPASWIRIQQAADSTRQASMLSALNRHAKSRRESSVETRLEDRDFLKKYRRILIREHGFISPPDFNERKRIPIEKIYVAPSITREGNEGTSHHEGISTTDLIGRIDRSVLLGDPGGGKTTASNVIVHNLAIGESGQVPLFVILREFAKEDPPAASVVKYIENRIETNYQVVPPKGLVEKWLLTGKAVVIFDGLDELIDTGRRADVSQRVENFCEHFPQAPVLVTSRRVGYEQAKLDKTQFEIFHLGEFTESQTRSYVEKWFSQENRINSKESKQWSNSFMEESDSISDIRSNPLTLALLCILYRGEGSLPKKRPEIYEECSKLLFEKWDSHRRINVDIRTRGSLHPLLRHVAYRVWTSKSTAELTEKELVKEATDFLHDRYFEDEFEARSAAQEFIDFCKGRAWVITDMGTTAAGDRIFTFTHRTFLEYFSASHISAKADTPEQLARELLPRIAKREWDMVAQLASQIKARAVDDGGSRFVSKALATNVYKKAESTRNVISFIANSLSYLDVSPRVTRQVVDRVFEWHMSSVWEVSESASHAMDAFPVLGFSNLDGTKINAVAHRLEVLIDDYLEAASSEQKKKALLFIESMNGAYVFSSNHRVGSVVKNSEFFSEWCSKVFDRHREIIRSLAKIDNSILHLAIYRGYVSLDEALHWKKFELQCLIIPEVQSDMSLRPGSNWVPVLLRYFPGYSNISSGVGIVEAHSLPEAFYKSIKNSGIVPKVVLSRGQEFSKFSSYGMSRFLKDRSNGEINIFGDSPEGSDLSSGIALITCIVNEVHSFAFDSPVR